ncbi:type II secretion system major pseudopilin GspG [Emcibacteraceae bacterium Y4]|nr:type II secretion system major pseudopilin GspG [Pseudemcibacter aquimaris]WDU60270.1 type II secretion system major pseudopilin GspG [Pseudemcibacter aquimaris]
MKKRENIFTRHLNNEDGFSLIELMVVVVIMGLLTTVVVINVLPNQDRAMVEKARADIRVISQAIEMYRLDQMKYPSMEQGLEGLVNAPDNNAFRSEGYIRSLPEDPWGQQYQYLIPGEHGAFDVFSFGADGRLGGEGLDLDIGNWNEGA